jgi:hypothetical protein
LRLELHSEFPQIAKRAEPLVMHFRTVVLKNVGEITSIWFS